MKKFEGELLDPIVEAHILTTMEFAHKVGLPDDWSAHKLVKEYWDMERQFIPYFEGFWPAAHNFKNEVWLLKSRPARGPTFNRSLRSAIDKIELAR